MSHHETEFKGDVLAALREAIEAALPGAVAQVTGGGGHYTLVVTSPLFAGKSRLESQRLVYSAIAHLMKGDSPPVHAVDRLDTRTSG
jgi:acid stress-induced BolA-like protein IbaG/YrbA